jgi:holo-[acyl-carrier protein] synthase
MTEATGAYGLGVDLVHVPDFAAQLALPGSRFLTGVFTPGEAADAASRPDPTRALAARYAAKEALIKAWSATRFGLPPALATVDLREIEVVCDAWHRPALRLHGAMRDAVGALRATVSLSHDGPTAIAVVTVRG